MIPQHKKKVVECISFQKQESLCNIPLLHNQVLKPFPKFDVFSSHKSITNNGEGVVLGSNPCMLTHARQISTLWLSCISGPNIFLDFIWGATLPGDIGATPSKAPQYMLSH